MASKLPDMSEITHIAGKLFSDIKKSVTEICEDYKAKRQNEEESTKKEDDNTKEQ